MKKLCDTFEKVSWYSLLPSRTQDVDADNLRLFFSTMHERQCIWRRRFIDHRTAPWTSDCIFQQNKFTNVYRELDRSSQWQIRNIILDNSLSLKNYIWKIMVYRYINNPDTFQRATRYWTNGVPDYDSYIADAMYALLEQIKREGFNPFTSAYYINSTLQRGKSRNWVYCYIIFPRLQHHISHIIRTVLTAQQPTDIITVLCQLPGVSRFIAHEFYQDFTYIARYTQRKFMRFTQNDYTNIGPGAALGLRLIFPSLYTIDQRSRAVVALRNMSSRMLEDISQQQGEAFAYVTWDKQQQKYVISNTGQLTLHQIEMWLCEFGKYWKTKFAVGRQRTHFIPHYDNKAFE